MSNTLSVNELHEELDKVDFEEVVVCVIHHGGDYYSEVPIKKVSRYGNSFYIHADLTKAEPLDVPWAYREHICG